MSTDVASENYIPRPLSSTSISPSEYPLKTLTVSPPAGGALRLTLAAAAAGCGITTSDCGTINYDARDCAGVVEAFE